VPLLVSHPKQFKPRHVPQSVSTLDILPTLVDLVGAKLVPGLPMDGVSMIPHLYGGTGHDNVFAEYMGEGTIAPLMMIRRGPWKYITCPADPPQLFDVSKDPLELVNLATSEDKETQAVLQAFELEATQKWDFEKITQDVLIGQRRRAFVWKALTQGRFESWDWKGNEDGRTKYIRSQIPLDQLELKARFPTHQNMSNSVAPPKSVYEAAAPPELLVKMASDPVHYR
jgi:hypothetical protein